MQSSEDPPYEGGTVPHIYASKTTCGWREKSRESKYASLVRWVITDVYAGDAQNADKMLSPEAKRDIQLAIRDARSSLPKFKNEKARSCSELRGSQSYSEKWVIQR